MPQFDLANAVEETLFVQTTVDSDLDGVKDRVRVRLSRPGETETQGIKVPVIFEHSPYRYNTGGGENHNVDFSVLPQEGIQPNRPRAAVAAACRAVPDLPGSLDNYWVPRGYAVVLGESIGTGFSDGCPTVGDMKETLGTKAVIDWLNGRAQAYNEAGEPVEADWTTGDVGMVGTSYNGTLPNQVATTGVEGLRTIVPDVGDRQLVRLLPGERPGPRAALGRVRPGRERLPGRGPRRAGRTTSRDRVASRSARTSPTPCCSTPIGLPATTTRTGTSGTTCTARAASRRACSWCTASRTTTSCRGRTRRGGRSWSGTTCRARSGCTRAATAARPAPSDYQRTLNRWMDYWLFGVRNGIMSEPRADIQRPDGTYEKYADWPVPGSRNTTLQLSSPNATDPGGLARKGGGPRQSFVDSGRTLDTDVSLLPNPDAANPNRLAYLSAPLAGNTHLSGTPIGVAAGVR